MDYDPRVTPAPRSKNGRLRGVLLALPLLVASPSVLAAFGVWTPWGARQQAWVLDSLLAVTLRLEDGVFASGVLGTWEIPTALAGLALLTASAAWWQPRLPPAANLILALPEAALACLGLLGAAGLVAVGVSVDRALFLFGLLAGGVAAHGRGRIEAPWASRSNLAWRLAVALGSAAALIYGAASLLEGATWTNPVFRVSRWWVHGPGQSPWSSGGIWLGVGLLSLPAFLRGRSDQLRPAAALAAVGLIGSVLGAGAAHLAIARAVSAVGLLALVVAWAPWLAPPRAPPGRVLDPRRLARAGLPLLLWAGLCALRGLSISMWTAPSALPPGVELLAEQDCVFSLRAAGEDAWFTDRCRNRLGRVSSDGALHTWDLAEYGGTQVEELGGPEDHTLFAAIAAWTDEAQLVLLAIDDEVGPRRVDEGYSEGPFAPYVPLPACWASAWIGLPDGRVLLGCENTSRAHLLDPERRVIDDTVELGTRIEAGSFDAGRSRLYGVALWEQPHVRAWSWPSGELRAERIVGPFNWSALHVPSDDSVWVSRFLEGSILRLDPEDLSLSARVPLSFGVRALHHDPVHNMVWAAASYSGRLWAVPVDDPGRRRSFALCGQARDLATDARGRLLVGTDCGIYRITLGDGA